MCSIICESLERRYVYALYNLLMDVDFEPVYPELGIKTKLYLT